ncbi:hypothetical protein AYO41_01615 [Verrucomicrobia bacterium SCGC AG-212-E04]|nr:hypothetical protein AYO41_01615 [Verrucomicrobia bacterium SCGC AG-212-E04]
MSNLALLALEYESLRRAFVRYLRENVKEGDVVVVGSFPPNTTHLHSEIKRRGAVAVYWLQDYYPEYCAAALPYPHWMRRRLVREWDVTLRKWDYVVKGAANLGYDSPNTRVIRNWPTMEFKNPRPAVPKTALYAGNLGYAHSVPHLLKACSELRDQGYRIQFYADGKGVSQLPSWIEKNPCPTSEDDLERIMLDAEIHLVAADPRFQHSLFPSKLWNALAAGRRVVATGFEGAMHDELQIALTEDFHEFVPTWVRFIRSLI